MDPIPLSLPFLMDGATGTELQKRGMPLGACTEQWALEHPEALLELQRAYVEAGAQVLVTPTLGANRGALEKFGLADRVEEYNARLTGLTRQAAAGRALVAGDLGPTLHAIPPYGETPFEVLVGFYAEQAAALERAGVDLFLVESVMAMAEARAAVLGIRESGSRRPILVTCYCDEEGRTPSGTDVLACAIVMQGMGVTAFGLNCVDPAVAEVSHINVNEGSVEGLRYLNGNVLTVQFHPEASPGPRDTESLFDRFVRRMEGGEW